MASAASFPLSLNQPHKETVSPRHPPHAGFRGGMETIGGDWALRGLDFETYLVGAVTDKIIDADRLARKELSNGFPGWVLYRTFLCGDHHLRTKARDWCVAYAIAAAEAGIVRAGLPIEDVRVRVRFDRGPNLLIRLDLQRQSRRKEEPHEEVYEDSQPPSPPNEAIHAPRASA